MVPLSLGEVPPPPPPNSATVDTVETVFMWIIILLDSVIFAVAFAWMVYLLWRKAGWNIRKLLSCMLPWPMLFRVIDMGVHFNQHYLTENLNTQSIPSIIVGALPGYLFVSTYLLLCFSWVFMYYRAHDKRATVLEALKWVYIAINAAIYVIFFTLVLLMAVTSPTTSDTIHRTEAVYAASLNVIAGGVFVLYGSQLMSKLYTERVFVPSRLAVSKKILLVTLVCTVLFGVRSLLIILDLFVLTTAVENMVSKIVFEILCEALPVVFIMAVLLVRQVREDQKRIIQ